MARNLEAELAQEGSAWPQSWKPEVGETLVGVILRYSSGPSRYGPVRTAIIEKDDGGKCSLWLSSIVLLDLFKRERPKVGERIGVRYLGKHEKGYRRWSLVVDRPAAELDFSPLGGEPRQEEPPTRATDRGGPYAAATLSRGAATLSRGAAVVSGAAPEYDDDDDPFR